LHAQVLRTWLLIHAKVFYDLTLSHNTSVRDRRTDRRTNGR